MPEYLEFEFVDGSSVLLQAFPINGEASPAAAGGSLDGALDLRPPEASGGRPVARSGQGEGQGEGENEQPHRVARLTQDALRTALRPLVPLLQEVHDTVARVPQRPHEVSVEFGVRFGSDLRLGIVGGSGEASMRVTATWQLPGE
ncbi:CU044_2847 family protein [Kitasatospora sp. MAA4]|uniref:CU044_2847 family protein n=1 Tax=Kitasatospora sp. MAA4 TaxID=3035093 RepID=UPI00247625EB|nr:CU044_2847 family protein [Kitasatospora sp. MAA4]